MNVPTLLQSMWGGTVENFVDMMNAAYVALRMRAAIHNDGEKDEHEYSRELSLLLGIGNRKGVWRKAEDIERERRDRRKRCSYRKMI